MKRNRMKLFACILSVALLVSFGTMGQQKDITEVNAVTEATTQDVQTVDKVTTFNLDGTTQTKKLTLEELKNISQKIIPGTIISTDYDYEMGKQIVCFKIVDKNGIGRELELDVRTGKVYDIDYDYDEQGNRFINKNLFEVNKSFEECQTSALAKIPGGQVINSKQDVDYGLFMYDFIIKGNDGLLYEVDVETKNGTVIKVEVEDDYYEDSYNVKPVVLNTTASAPQATPAVQPVAEQTPAPAPAPQPAPTVQTVPAPAPAPQQSGALSESQLRQKVLAKYPGTVVNNYTEWDDGLTEHHYIIKQSNGSVVEVEIAQNGWIKDVDYEGFYNNGQYYDDDYYDWD